MDQDTFLSGVEILDSSVATSSTASLYTYGGISVFSTALATDFNNGGSLLALGGAAITKNTIIGGDTRIFSTTVSSSTSTGSLIVNGGVAVQGSLYGNVSNFSYLQVSTTATIPTLITSSASIGSLFSSSFNPTNVTTSNLVSTTSSMGTLVSSNILSTNMILSNVSASNINISSTAVISGTQFTPYLGGTWIDMPGGVTASAIGSGGPGSNPWIGYAGNSGNYFTNSIAGDICYRNTGSLLFGNTAGSSTLQISNNVVAVLSTVNSTGTSNGSLVVNGGVSIKKDLFIAGATNITSTTVSSSISSGGH